MATPPRLADYLLRHGRLPLGWVAVLAQPAWAPAIALLAAAIVLFHDGQLPSRLRRWPLRLWVGDIAVIGTAALPASMAMAILRYRLHEIDRIISRTLACNIVPAASSPACSGYTRAWSLLATQVLSVFLPGGGGRLDARRRQRCSARCAGECS
jgi:hypothetical protein